VIYYVAFVATANLALLVVHTIRKGRTNRDILAALAAAEARERAAEERERAAQEREREVWADVLPVVKAYKESARIHRQEAELAAGTLGAKVDAATGELAQQIESVPAKVVDALAKGDSGVLKTTPPGGG
jgi:ribosome-binding protein aMBF1 (putative translation factor)